jgi:hypothetical protein
LIAGAAPGRRRWTIPRDVTTTSAGTRPAERWDRRWWKREVRRRAALRSQRAICPRHK